MPPLQALVALHGLWALTFLPVIVAAVRKCPPRHLVFLSWITSALGLTSLALLISREWFLGHPTLDPDLRNYLPQRILYVLGTNTDAPVVQVLLAGIILLFFARRRKRRVELAESETRDPDSIVLTRDGTRP